MLDIKFIRENKDLVKEAARKKHSSFEVEKLLEIDEKRISLLTNVDGLRGEQNKMNNSIAAEKDTNIRSQMINEMRSVKEDLNVKEEELKTVMAEWQS